MSSPAGSRWLSPARFSPIVAILPLLLALGRPARAQVEVEIEPAEGSDFAAMLGIDLAELERQLREQLEDAFSAVDPEGYLRAMSDAQAFSTKGLGADYASNLKAFEIGLAGNISVAVGNVDEDHPAAGVAPNLALMVAFNPGVLESVKSRDWITYANFFHRGFTFDETFDASLTNLGLHVQYKAFRPSDSTAQLILQWGGLDFTSGIEYSRYRLSLEQALPVDLEVAGEQADAPVRFDSTGTLELVANTFAVPIEVSTNVRLLYLASLYVGVGLDLQVGSSKLDVGLDGGLTGIDPRDQSEVALGTAVITAKEDSGPHAALLRFMFGVQVNLWKLRLFTQANIGGGQAFGVALGTRLAF